MLSYDEAIEIVRQTALSRPLAVEIVTLSEAPGRILATVLTAPMDNQPFDNSTMDGFAVRASDVTTAPVTLEVIGQIAAGDAPTTKEPQAGQCYEIMTGAPIPKGCDAVIPVEETLRQKDKITVQSVVSAGRFIRRAGQDFKKGTIVLEAGTLLTSSHILPLATLGIADINVRSKARIAILSTGPELIDDLSHLLAPGKIYNASGLYLKAIFAAFGAEIVLAKTIPDDPEVFTEALNEASKNKADIVISTGAVSVGAHDFIHGALAAAGTEILFHQVKIRPGKPGLFAKLPEGGLFFGLPGNPVSSACGARFFVYPALRAMSGLAPEAPEKAVLTNDFKKPSADFTFFLKSRKESGGRVGILPGQDSFMVSPFLHMDSWTVGKAGQDVLAAGEAVDTYPLIPYT